MALIARYLIDTSAAARMGLPAVHDRLAPLIRARVVATCATLDSEALYSARSPGEYEQLWADRRTAYEYLAIEDEHWQRALAGQRQLASTGRRRAVGIADLLTAVLAGDHRVTVVHYDADFETAAEILSFEHRWVVPRGSL